MARKFLVNINLSGNQLLNALAHPASASPTTYGKGQLWFDTTNNQLNVSTTSSTFSPLALQSYVTGLGYVTSSGSVAGATNADQLGGTVAASYAKLASPTFTGTVSASNINATGALTASIGTTTLGTTNMTGDLSVSGSIFMSGSAFTVSASNIIVSDPLIYIANGNAANLNEIGIVGHFTSGTYQHTGLARDHTDGIWKLFSGITDEPTNTINFASATYDGLKTGGLIVNSSSTTTTASITAAGAGNFSSLSIAGAAVATQSFVTTSYAPLASPTFTGTVNLGTNVATGSVSGNAVTTSQTNFSALTISSSAVATQSYVTAQGYVTSSGSVAGATNATQLGGTAASAYALLSSANFTAASVGSARILTTGDKISAHAATTSAELLGVISDETGSGSLVFNTSPTFSGTVNLGATVATGSVTSANNSASLAGQPGSYYAPIASPNFTTGASVNGSAILTSGNSVAKYSASITGNSSSTTFTITHNLGTLDVLARVYQLSSGPDTQYADVEVDITRTTTSALTVAFATAPATGENYKVIVLG